MQDLSVAAGAALLLGAEKRDLAADLLLGSAPTPSGGGFCSGGLEVLCAVGDVLCWRCSRLRPCWRCSARFRPEPATASAAGSPQGRTGATAPSRRPLRGSPTTARGRSSSPRSRAWPPTRTPRPTSTSAAAPRRR